MTGAEVYSWIPGEPVEGATIGADRNTHHPGERSKLSLGVATPDPDGRVTITDTSGNVVRDLGIQSGTSHPTFRMPEVGRYQVRENGDVIATFEVKPRTEPAPNGEFNDEAFSTREDDSGPDPADLPGVVNSDKPNGVALAPALRRRGVEVDDVGTTATVQGEEFEIVDEGVVEIGDDRIEVGDITDPDEVARVVDGPNVGDPVATDVDVAPDSSSGGSDGGMIGAVGIGIVAVLAGAAAVLGG